MKPPTRFSPALLTLIAAAPFGTTGCFSSAQVRIENVSSVDFHQVELGDTPYGEVPTGTKTEYKPVRLVPLLRYADLRLTARGHRVTGQTLMHRAKRFTHRVDIIDLKAGQLHIEVIREPRDPSGQGRDSSGQEGKGPKGPGS